MIEWGRVVPYPNPWGNPHKCVNARGGLRCDICFGPISREEIMDRDRTLHSLHANTFEYLKPTADQLAQMEIGREATKLYAGMLDTLLPEGPDKTYVLRQLRGLAMWVNVCLTRRADGTPRNVVDPDV